MAPDDDFLLREDDELLLAGRLRARAALKATTSDVSVASYVLDGRRVPSSWIWRRLTGVDSAGNSR